MAAAGWGRGYRRRGRRCRGHDRAGPGATAGVRGGGSVCLSLHCTPLPAATVTARDVRDAPWGATPAEGRGCSSVTLSSVVLRTKNPYRLSISRVVYPMLDAGYIILRLLETVSSALKTVAGPSKRRVCLSRARRPALCGTHWGRPWAVPAAAKALPRSLRVLRVLPPKGLCDGDSDSELDGPCPIWKALEENK